MTNHGISFPHIAKQQCSAIKIKKNTNDTAKALAWRCRLPQEIPKPHSKHDTTETKPDIAKAFNKLLSWLAIV